MSVEPPRWSRAASWWEDFRHAALFLTRLKLPHAGAAEEPGLAAASWAFPLVGACVGLVAGIAFALSSRLGLPALVSALIALGAGILLTGGLHEDGLADTADGFGGGAGREAKLAIMRDSRIGSFGVLALVFSVALRAAALAAFPGTGRAVAALIAAHAVGRGVLPLVLRALAPARADGLGAAAGRPEPVVAWTAAAIAAVIAFFMLDFLPALAALAATALAAALVAGLARRQIGGYTGDVLGAIEQVSETVMILAAAASWAI
jgi:adenosylcobinamide-GDP ribazoletransferase